MAFGADDNVTIDVITRDRSSSALGKLGRSFGRFAGMTAGLVVAATAAAAAGLTAIAFSAIGAASEVEEMQAKFDVVFKNTKDDLIPILDELAATVGRNKFELRGFAANLGDTFKPLGFAEEAAADMALQLTTLGVDIASFNNLADPDVINALTSAIVGNHESVRQFGVVITQATLDQELMNMGIEGGASAATEQEKALARMNLIVAGTSDAQGDAARTAGSFANQMRAAKAQMGEAAAALGQKLLPVVTPLIGIFSKLAGEILPPLLEKIGVFAEKAVILAPIIQGVIDVLIFGRAPMGSWGDAWDKINSIIGVEGANAFTKMLRLFQKFRLELQTNLRPAMFLIKDALVRIAAVFGINAKEVSGFDIALGSLKFILDIIVAAIQAAALVMQGLAFAFEGVNRFLREGIAGWEKFGNAVVAAMSLIPAWMRPGSKTPFEIGLRGIIDAMGTLNSLQGPTLVGVGGAGVAGTGGGHATINIYPSDSIGLAEVQTAVRETLGG